MLLGLYISIFFVKGVIIHGANKEYWFNFLAMTAILYIFYFAIMPILKILTLPITFISFGLFYFVLIFGALRILDKYIDFVTIESSLALVAFAVIMSSAASLAKNL